MPVTNHDIYHEFPEHHQKIQELLTSSTHFAALVERYHEVDKRVHIMEQGAIHGLSEACDPYKRKRLKLKDQLYSYIRSH